MSEQETPSAEAIKDEIARELVRVHENSYGESASNVEIALHEGFVTVIMDLDLLRPEEILIEAGDASTVAMNREAFQLAIADTFTAIVERATGRRVIGFAGRVVLDRGARPWAIEIFRLDGDRRQFPRLRDDLRE